MKNKNKYRAGTCYKLLYGRIFCIQKENFIGWVNIFETASKKEWEIEYQKLKNKGIIFENEK